MRPDTLLVAPQHRALPPSIEQVNSPEHATTPTPDGRACVATNASWGFLGMAFRKIHLSEGVDAVAEIVGSTKAVKCLVVVTLAPERDARTHEAFRIRGLCRRDASRSEHDAHDEPLQSKLLHCDPFHSRMGAPLVVPTVRCGAGREAADGGSAAACGATTGAGVAGTVAAPALRIARPGLVASARATSSRTGGGAASMNSTRIGSKPGAVAVTTWHPRLDDRGPRARLVAHVRAHAHGELRREAVHLAAHAAQAQRATAVRRGRAVQVRP
ncbi:MAG: hypothetical protein WCJ30_16285 [Deltaproteobacteria bacterium]